MYRVQIQDLRQHSIFVENDEFGPEEFQASCNPYFDARLKAWCIEGFLLKLEKNLILLVLKMRGLMVLNFTLIMVAKPPGA